MFRQIVVGCCTLAVSVACDESTQPEQPPPLPQPTVDQVGLPADYATSFTPFYVFDQAQNRQVRVVYANDVAVAGPPPFALGSILVMETWPAKRDAQGVPLVDANGRYIRDTLSGIFVARKEKWFGRRYGVNQTGEWEYASYQSNGNPNVVGDAAVSCAICHVDAGPSRDWIYRANIHFGEASGAIPQPPPGQPADTPFVLNYTFVPGTTTVPVGTKITWRNDDEVKHTVTATDFDAPLPQGATASLTFFAADTIDYFCKIHRRMTGRVIVQP